MNKALRFRVVDGFLIGFFVVLSCGGPATRAPDVVATQVAEELAVIVAQTERAPTATATPSSIATATPTLTPTATPTFTPMPTPTFTPTPTPDPTHTRTPRPSATAWPEPTTMPTPSPTPGCRIADGDWVGSSDNPGLVLSFGVERCRVDVLVLTVRVGEDEWAWLALAWVDAPIQDSRLEYQSSTEQGRYDISITFCSLTSTLPTTTWNDYSSLG
jgi:hypothetical protein